jgi:hypothetical protein
MRGYIVLILLIYSANLYPQKKYQEGYVITNDRDTLYGFVKDRNEAPFANIYKKVRFRRNAVFTRRYGPEQISGYKSGERTYESIWLESRTQFLKTSYLSKPGNGKKIFLRADHQGYLTLYQMEWTDQESGTFEEFPLFKRENDEYFIRVTQGILGLRKNALREYFANCQDLLIMIENGALKSPEEIATFYNQKCGKQKVPIAN